MEKFIYIPFSFFCMRVVQEEGDVSELKLILKESLEKIKGNLQSLKEEVENIRDSHVYNSKEIFRHIEGMKDDFVTIDKYNVLRIKLGDIYEDMKEVRRLDGKLSGFMS